MRSHDNRIRPLNYFSGARGAIAIITVGFINRVAAILNAVLGVKGTGGIRVVWSDGCLVIDGSDITAKNQSTSNERHWVLLCKKIGGVPTPVFACFHVAEFRHVVTNTDGTIKVGTPLSGSELASDGEPFTTLADSPLPE